MAGLIILILLLLFAPLILVITGAVIKGSSDESKALSGRNMLRLGLVLLAIELALILIGFAICTGSMG
jgi:ABC-type sulfate transport system permease subunit